MSTILAAAQATLASKNQRSGQKITLTEEISWVQAGVRISMVPG